MADDEVQVGFEPAIVIDKVRASKAGHAFHEAWAARSALELLLPSTDLVAITLEGFNSADEADLGTGAVEIADLVRYHGHNDVARASRVEIVQFKYSIASAAVPVRAADLAKTLTKFAKADAELRARHGDDHVQQVVRYDFATNRPIHPNLITAMAATIDASHSAGDVATQLAQIAKALGSYPYPREQLLRRLFLSGARGSLEQAELAVGNVLASWSEAGDPQIRKAATKAAQSRSDQSGAGGRQQQPHRPSGGPC